MKISSLTILIRYQVRLSKDNNFSNTLSGTRRKRKRRMNPHHNDLLWQQHHPLLNLFDKVQKESFCEPNVYELKSEISQVKKKLIELKTEVS